MPIPPPPLPSLAVATRTATATGVATTAAITVAATAVALSMGMSAALFGFAAAGTNTNSGTTSGGGGGAAVSGDPNLVSVGDQFVRGNANDDGYLNVTDANYILNFLYNNGGKPVCMDAADVNDSGSVDLSDAKYLMDFLFSGTAAPKAPWPGRGVDPTPDSLGCKPNLPPVADAGPDVTVVSGTLVVLNGIGHDPENSGLSFLWKQIAGPSVTLSSDRVVQPTFTAPTVSAPTVLTFVMTVTDGAGLSSSDTVTVTVLPPNKCVPSWACTAWDTCRAGTQRRTCTDANSCGTVDGKPAEFQDCACVPNWTCSEWSVCLANAQTRTCSDVNQCGTNAGRPTTEQSCQSATLTIARAPTSPEAGLLPGNTSGLAVGTFIMAANGEGVRVEKLWLTALATNPSIRPAGPWNQVQTIYLYEGNTLLSSITPTSTDRTATGTLFDVTGNPIDIAAGAIKQITIKVDTANVSRYPRANRGVSGQGFRLLLRPSDLLVKSMATGERITNIATDGGPGNVGSPLNDMTVYVSVPTVATNDQLGAAGISSGSLATAAAKDLYRFRVKADSAGDIGLYQVSFLISTSTATATKMHLHDGTKVVAATRDAARSVQVFDHGSVAIFSFIFTNDGLVARGTGGPNVEPVTVSAGAAKTFTLRGDLACSSGGQFPCAGSTGSGSVQVQFLGDANFPYRYPDSASTWLSGMPYENSFIWGDYAITGPLTTASGTAKTAEQWTNGFRVASESGKLPATSTAVTFSK